ncbi:MAG: transposase, partial [Albidovulum sp.]|nr:transposase [Albidovulum sp.]
LSKTAAQAKPLRSLLNHREGLCVFVDHPEVPMDNNVAERAIRGPAIGRKLSFGSDSEAGALMSAVMYSVLGTVARNGLDILRWLRAWLDACAENGGRPPADLSPWLPWSMSEERRRAFEAPP